jgi:hypothetical protein
MGSQDDFFEALGPTRDPPNDSPGFFTNASGLFRGVDVAGKHLGVRGTGTDPGAPGVIGEGGLGDNVTAGGNGVFGHGMNGVVGYSATATRLMATEMNEPAGVFGVGDGSSAVGVRGESVGPNAGVVGVSRTSGGVDAGPGVRGQSDGIGVVGQGDIGIFADGDHFGVQGVGKTGPAIQGHSTESHGGVFESARNAQLLLVPNQNLEPPQLKQSDAGSLAVAITLDAPR